MKTHMKTLFVAAIAVSIISCANDDLETSNDIIEDKGINTPRKDMPSLIWVSCFLGFF